MRSGAKTLGNDRFSYIEDDFIVKNPSFSKQRKQIAAIEIGHFDRRSRPRSTFASAIGVSLYPARRSTVRSVSEMRIPAAIPITFKAFLPKRSDKAIPPNAPNAKNTNEVRPAG